VKRKIKILLGKIGQSSFSRQNRTESQDISQVLLKAYSGIELSNHFIVLIFLESQDISQVLGLASCNDSVKDWIMLVLHVGPINPLRIWHWFALGHDY
jgi:hypothetical protein